MSFLPLPCPARYPRCRLCAFAKHVSPRRLIGRRFDDPTVKKDMESWPFTVLDDGGNPKIEVEYLGEKKSFSAQEISSMVLLKVRSTELIMRALVALLTPPHR